MHTCIYTRTQKGRVEDCISSLLAVSLLLINIGSFGWGRLTSLLGLDRCQVTEMPVCPEQSLSPAQVLLWGRVSPIRGVTLQMCPSPDFERSCVGTHVCIVPATKTSRQLLASATFHRPKWLTPDCSLNSLKYSWACIRFICTFNQQCLLAKGLFVIIDI